MAKNSNTAIMPSKNLINHLAQLDIYLDCSEKSLKLQKELSKSPKFISAVAELITNLLHGNCTGIVHKRIIKNNLEILELLINKNISLKKKEKILSKPETRKLLKKIFIAFKDV